MHIFDDIQPTSTLARLARQGRRYTLACLALAAGAAAATADAQHSGLGYVPGGFRRAVEQVSYPCPHEQPGVAPLPTPTPANAPPRERTTDDIPDPIDDRGVPADDYFPEVADLSGDVGFASASQSAAPNMIGDTIGYGGTGYITINGLLGSATVPFSPGGGRKFKASTNQSPVPEQRFFYNFHYFEDALAVQNSLGDIGFLDVVRNEVGWERTFLGGMMSAQIQLPFSSSIDSSITGFDLDGSDAFPDPRDTELGNIAIALKGLLYQTDCDALSIGLAIDFPTADDVLIEDVDSTAGTLSIENNAFTLSPFIGYVYQSPCRWFAQGFVQVAIPLSDNDYRLTNAPLNPFVSTVGDLEEKALLFADIGCGFWFYNSAFDGAGCGGKGCGKGGCCSSYGVAGMVELHYSTSLEGDEDIALDDFDSATFAYGDYEWLNLTLGLPCYYNCWSLAPAVVVPLREAPDRQFDVEFTVQLNKRY